MFVNGRCDEIKTARRLFSLEFQPINIFIFLANSKLPFRDNFYIVYIDLDLRYHSFLSNYTQDIQIKTRKFLFGTRTFSLETRNFSLQTRTFPLETRNFSLQTRTFPLETRNFSLQTRTFPLETRTSEFRTSSLRLRTGTFLL